MTAPSNAGEPDDDHAVSGVYGGSAMRQVQPFGPEAGGDRQHQTRNVLALMRSVFARTIENGTSLEDVEAHYQGRFDTLAPFLTFSGMDEGGAYDLQTLIWDEMLRYPVGSEENIEVGGPAERLTHALAQPIALALHELATNAVKFGALQSPGHGAIEVTWWRENAELVLRWREKGVSIVRPVPVRTGFGRDFIEQGLPYQIGAATSFELVPGRVEVTIRISPESRGTYGAGKQ